VFQFSVPVGGQSVRRTGTLYRAKSLTVNDLAHTFMLGTAPAPRGAMKQHLRSISIPSRLRAPLVGFVALVLTTGVAEGQRPVPQKPQNQQTQRRDQVVPPGFFPPAGMCRIWLNEVPARQQPAPTDCASAVRNRPANAKVLFGDEPQKGKKGKSNNGKSSTTDELVDLITRRISR
jgi:hypothetical protein